MNLKRCLHKEPRQRIPDIGVMRLALDGAFETTPLVTTTPLPSSSRVRTLAWTGAFALAAVAIAFLAVPVVQHVRELSPSETRVDIVTPPTDDLSSFALSPDGRQLAFVATENGGPRILLRSLDSTNARPLSGTEGATYPFWSPDSLSLGFFADGKLKRLDLGSTVPQTLANASPRGGAWGAAGIIVFQQRNDGPLMRIASSGGEAVAVTKVDRQSSHRFPVFLPDGRQFLFAAQGVAETRGIYLGSLDSSETFRLTPDSAAGVFVRPGWLLWPRDGTLVAQALDLNTHALTGQPVTVADSVIAENDSTSSAISASAAGLIAYRSGNAIQRQLIWVDRSGKRLGTVGLPDPTLNRPSVSPDGQTVAIDRLVQGNTDVWLVSTVRTTRLTLDPAMDRFPIWSPDGSHIAFDSNRRGFRDLYQKATSGGTDELLAESSQTKIPNDWSRDGRFLLHVRTDPKTGRDLWVQPTDGGQTPFVFLSTPAEERFGQFSPDGRWVTYMSNESGRDEVYIRPFAARSDGATGGQPGGQWQVSTAGGIHPRWRSDGKELYYLAPSGEMMAVPTPMFGTMLMPGTPVAIFATRVHGGGLDKQQGRQWDVARDGRFLINTLVSETTAPITLLQNWNPPAPR